jgi:deoxycytidine triphosphate deaminase
MRPCASDASPVNAIELAFVERGPTTPREWPLAEPSWEKPEGLEEIDRSYWLDPLDGQPGAVLAADQIQFYCDLFGMIRPFESDRLRPASYCLTVGDLAEVGGGRRILMAEDRDEVVVPAHGRVRIVPAEVLVMPHYLIGRLGPTVQQVHRGLLMGAGSQIDPGFQGALSCPVYNLTDSEVVLRRGRNFARVDFVRTTGLASENKSRLIAIETEDQLYGEQDELLGVDRWSVPLRPRVRRWRHPLDDYPAD